MDELLRKVKKELDNIGDKGLTSSNLDTTYKLIDIYKDIKEAEYYECKAHDDDSYSARMRGGRYMGDWNDDYRHYPLKERDERYLNRIKEGLVNYNEGRQRYQNGESKERMVEGVDMAMGALVNFVEYMMDYSETPQEKEVIRKHIAKLKNI